MGTKLIDPKQNGADINRLTLMQRMFVKHLLGSVDFNLSAAAKEAGYANPAQMGTKLLKNKAIRALLGKEMRLREETADLKIEMVQEYLYHALWHNPLDHFWNNGDGFTVIDPASIPPHIGRLIESIDLKKTTNPKTGEVTEEFKVKLVSKSTVLGLVMKHKGMMIEKHEVESKVAINWDEMYTHDPYAVDLIEKRIESEGK
jgi:hypothetical protein